MNAEQPLVKVVVTSYNRQDLLRVAVQSVLAQTYRNVHVMIVDDASTDGSPELARELERANPGRVTALLKDRNMGIADSSRRGIQAGPQADYVAMLNEDDHWLPEKLERQLEMFRADPQLGMVFTEARVCDEQSALTGQLFSDIAARFTTFDFHDALRSNHSCASTHLMTAEIADIVAGTLPLESCLVDYYTVLVATGLAKMAMVEEPLAVYMDAPSGLHNQLGRNRRDTTTARERVFEKVPETTALLGGTRRVRQRLGWLTFDIALYSLKDGDLRTYWWQARHVLRQRALKPIVWLVLHTVRLLPGVVRRELSVRTTKGRDGA